MRRILLVVALAALVSVAGCSGFVGETGAPSSDADGTLETAGNGTVEAQNQTADATAANQTVQIEANESVAGSEWESLSVTYPRENFTVESAQHEEIALGVDTNGDGAIDREFNETHVSGVNNNDYSFTVELDADYTLEDGDVVVAEYPAVNNPSEPGEYAVEVTLNEEQTVEGTIEITADESG
ncbi:hypothetical protein [Halopiger xanaduensis]|uniref:Uncharacterized protein n=1 Tax=Halopiger xanaduensis (strain DSM 18323 / JCM 14033 / SH-6) TaxID=797210 RepID=F8D3I8_HALXS|nr:hypothetical protein [Halopiger xanaduensis]AEH36218.1 hypothetical protein Halxa_1586 [Halopiger xanaduensis SH-6]